MDSYSIMLVPDWKALLAFFGIGLTAFAAPALGYEVARPQWFTRALYLLVGVVAVDGFMVYFAPVRIAIDGYQKHGDMLTIIYLARLALYGGALLMFVSGLQSLKRGDKCPLATPPEAEMPTNGGSETDKVPAEPASQL